MQQPEAGVMVEALGYPMPHMLPSPACSPGAWVGASGFIPEQGFGQLGSSGGSRRVPAALAGGIGSALLTHPCPTELCQGLQSAELNPGLQTPHFGVSFGVFFFYVHSLPWQEASCSPGRQGRTLVPAPAPLPALPPSCAGLPGGNGLFLPLLEGDILFISSVTLPGFNVL